MNPCTSAHVACVAALGLALAGCVENSYQSKQGGRGVVTVEEVVPTAPVADLPAPAPAKEAPDAGPRGDAPAVAHQGPAEAAGYTLDGYRVYEDDGRLWVFRRGSDDFVSFVEKGEPAKRVTLIGEGPGGKTLLGADRDVMKAYAESATN